MRRLLPLSAALALAVLGSAPASAAARSHALGGCGVLPVPNTFPPVAVVYVSAALYSQEPRDNPVSAEVTCVVSDVFGAHYGDVRFAGTGAVRGAQLVYGAAPALRVCTIVDFTSDDTPTRTTCAQFEDLLLCPLLRALVPGIGPVRIVEEGDVYLDTVLVWDCPPYA